MKNKEQGEKRKRTMDVVKVAKKGKKRTIGGNDVGIASFTVG